MYQEAPRIRSGLAAHRHRPRCRSRPSMNSSGEMRRISIGRIKTPYGVENRVLGADPRDHSSTTPQTNFKLVDRGLFLFSKTDRIHAEAICDDDGDRGLKTIEFHFLDTGRWFARGGRVRHRRPHQAVSQHALLIATHSQAPEPSAIHRVFLSRPPNRLGLSPTRNRSRGSQSAAPRVPQRAHAAFTLRAADA